MKLQGKFTVAYVLLAFISVGAVTFLGVAGITEPRVIEVQVDRPVRPDFSSYEAVLETLGPGTALDPKEIGATGATECMSWSPGDSVQVVACR